MADNILWEYLEELPEQEAAWREWQFGLTGWHRFNLKFSCFFESIYRTGV